MTIHSVTAQILARDYVASEGLKRDLLNLNAYAEAIQDQVEKLLGEEVNPKAISVALSRIAKVPVEEKTFKAKIFKDFNVKSGFSLLSLNKKLTISHLNKWRVDHPEAGRFTQLYTYGTTTLIAEQKLIKEIRTYIPEEEVISQYNDLYLLTAAFQRDLSKDKYVVLTIVREIANSGVNIYANFTGSVGVGFVVNQEDLSKATEVFTSLIEDLN